MPCHASHELLDDDNLRDEWGFDGIVVSDYTGIQMLSTKHELTADLGIAAALAIRAGLDTELPSTVTYGALSWGHCPRGASTRRWSIPWSGGSCA